MNKLPVLDPDMDGVDHINIYSRGRTWVGRSASNFAKFPVTLPDHGSFDSLEGYWYWLLTGNDELRSVSGVDAKQAGRRSLKTLGKQKPEDFEERFKTAIREKVRQHEGFSRALQLSTPPFVHYYVMPDRQTGDRRVVDANNHPWMMHEWECVRAELQGKPAPQPPASIQEPEKNKDQGDQIDLF